MSDLEGTVRRTEGSRRLTRRSLLGGAVTMGLGLPVIGALAACTPQATPATPTSGGTSAAPTPVPTKRVQKDSVVMGDWQELITLNALYTVSANSLSAGKLSQRGLLFVDKDSNWIGELASEVPTLANGGVTADGKKITYKLRSGVTWHDGKPVTSADVQATWQAIMDPTSGVISRAGYDRIASVETPDPQTVVVSFKTSYASWPILFDALMPKHVVDANKGNIAKAEQIVMPLGFGPYKMVQHKRGEVLEYAAFDGYFRGKPKIARFFMKFYPSVDALVQAVAAKEVDLGWNLNLSAVPKIQAMSSNGIELSVSTMPSQERYVINPDQKNARLFGDKNVRQALYHAIDRRTIIDKVLYGKTRIASSDWAESPWENKELKAYEFDAGKARSMLDAAGWRVGADGVRTKDGVRFSFVHKTSAGNLERENVQLLVQQFFKDVGVEMKIENKQTAELYGTYAQKGQMVMGNFEMAGLGQALRVPDPDISVRYRASEVATETKAGSQFYRYANPEVERLFDQAALEFDAQKRKAHIMRIQEILHDDAYMLFLYVTPRVAAVRAELKGFELNPFANYYFHPELWEWS